MKRAHFIVLKNPDGSPTLAPMKAWLRENPQEVPKGFNATGSTSHQLRMALSANGWELKELHDRTLLIKPDESGDTTFADEEFDNDEEEIAEAAEITFGLERDLQSALRANISQLESGLEIADGGKERKTDAGWIDITAKDREGNVVVIELKAGPASPDIIAQVLAYMGAVAEADKMPVRGILVAGDFHKRVIWASRAIPNVELKKYAFQFTFETVN
jgi:hypothetical protein